MTIYERIQHVLNTNTVTFKTLHHEATRTSEESAQVRGEPLEVGAKAIVMKVGKEFKLFVISAARRIDARKIKAIFHVKKVRFATADELKALTGLLPGSVPPFGRPIIDLDLFVDESIEANDRVAFNAGSLTDSIIMARSDYMDVAGGTVLDFAQ